MKWFKFRDNESDFDEEERIEGERSFSAVNMGVSLQNKVTNWIVMGGACLLALVLLYKYYAGVYEQSQEAGSVLRARTRTSCGC